jgi:GTP-binding protein EngB required for normal cell division
MAAAVETYQNTEGVVNYKDNEEGETFTGKYEEFEVFENTRCDVLILGESRTGKSTWKNVLRNPNHITQLEVWRGTKNPETTNTLFKIGGRFISVNIIDTPGFGEASAAARTDDDLRNLITKFVKEDITRLNLVLIAINGSGGMTASQVKNITNCIKFLGKQISPKTCFLVTHFENRTAADEQKWVADFTNNPNMRFLMRACGGGFLFTGALNKNQFDVVGLRDAFLYQQRKRNAKLFAKMLNGDAVSLRSREMEDARSAFAVSESITTSCSGLRSMNPEIISILKHAYDTRLKISKILAIPKFYQDPENKSLIDRAEAIVQEMGFIGTPEHDVKSLTLDEGVEKTMAECAEISKHIQEKFNDALDRMNKYSEADTKGSVILNELEWLVPNFD